MTKLLGTVVIIVTGKVVGGQGSELELTPSFVTENREKPRTLLISMH